MIALAFAGCAPEYRDYTTVAADSAVAGPRRQPAAKREPAAKKAAIPLPSQNLLAAPRKPDCGAEAVVEDKAENLPARSTPREAAAPPATPDTQASAAPAPRPPDPNADLALRIKLEYERECYRQAEMRVREQLQRLQMSTSETVKAVRRLEGEAR
jgi:hypothetical protein